MSISGQIARLLGLEAPLKVGRECEFRDVKPGEFWSHDASPGSIDRDNVWLRVTSRDLGYSCSVAVRGAVNGHMCSSGEASRVVVWAKEE